MVCVVPNRTRRHQIALFVRMRHMPALYGWVVRMGYVPAEFHSIREQTINYSQFWNKTSQTDLTRPLADADPSARRDYSLNDQLLEKNEKDVFALMRKA